MSDSLPFRFELGSKSGSMPKKTYWNLTPPLLYEEVIKRGRSYDRPTGAAGDLYR